MQPSEVFFSELRASNKTRMARTRVPILCSAARFAKLPRLGSGNAIQSLSYFEIAYCCIVIVLAYAARGSTGFGAAAAFPLLSLVLPIKVLIPAWTLLGIVAGITLVGRDWGEIAWREAAKILPGCVLGVMLGIFLFSIVDSVWL